LNPSFLAFVFPQWFLEPVKSSAIGVRKNKDYAANFTALG